MPVCHARTTRSFILLAAVLLAACAEQREAPGTAESRIDGGLRSLTPAEEERLAAQQRDLEARERAAVERFSIGEDGTVTDTATGLMWMRCALGQQWNGETCAGEAERFAWARALSTQGTVNAGGHGDWRLPTREELLTLTWCSSGRRHATDADGAGGSCVGDFRRPTILHEVFPATPAAKFWTSTAGHQNFSAWGVAFSTAVTGVGNKTDQEYVRMVRTAP
ncbi:Lcl C-terminal domain-containing protein [Pseudothauera nasutitermitis]|nr:DUF1566 domain-containing protein [Pseudothauera nasutitermitis]